MRRAASCSCGEEGETRSKPPSGQDAGACGWAAACRHSRKANALRRSDRPSRCRELALLARPDAAQGPPRAGGGGGRRRSPGVGHSPHRHCFLSWT